MSKRGTELLKAEKKIHELSRKVETLNKQIKKKDIEIQKLSKIIQETPIMYTKRIIKPEMETSDGKDVDSKAEDAAKAVIGIGK